MDRVNILLVDDRADNLLVLESLLKSRQLTFFRATSGTEALELLLKHEFALALIDVQMPDMDGFELAELMRGNEQTRSVPIIFVTAGVRDRLSTFRGYDRGAVDFLHKPLEPLIVKSKVQVFVDLAVQKRLLEKQLSETKRLLGERNDAIQSRDEFLSIASHELKTPLTSLHLQLQIMARLLRKPDLSLEAKIDRMDRGFAVCERQSRRLTSLLDELLDLTRIRLGKLQLVKAETNLSALCNEAIERFRIENPNLTIRLHTVEDATVKGNWDPTRIEQILTNLISNAIKYGDGKPIDIFFSESPEKERVFLEVRDEGVGIQEDMLEKIFLRFERAPETDAISGLGLGLYITRQIVEAHGGKISAESKLGSGSTFRVALPKNIEN
jgi:signal transduction histidine kinase